jgi:hypothetical protein
MAKDSEIIDSLTKLLWLLKYMNNHPFDKVQDMKAEYIRRFRI